MAWNVIFRYISPPPLRLALCWWLPDAGFVNGLVVAVVDSPCCAMLTKNNNVCLNFNIAVIDIVFSRYLHQTAVFTVYK